MQTHPSFGHWLQRRRKALDLTQAELGRRVGYARVTIHKIETSQLRPSRQMADKLADELAIAPAEREAFLRFARTDAGELLPAPLADPPDQALGSAPRPWRHNLPTPRTSFVGRQQALAQLRELSRGTRLLTLTGVGGCGKTRLALCLALDAIDDYPDGVWLAELAGLADASLLTQSVAAAIGLREVDGQPIRTTLLAALRSRHLLLVWDNCEHLIDACAELADAILRAGPDVHLLATSRQPLRIAGERAWRVPSLHVPPNFSILRTGAAEGVDQGSSEATLPRSAHRLSTSELALAEGCEAVQLFVERARAVEPSFGLTESNAAAVAEICRHLDGIPLAIELAAARIAALSPEQIASRLDRRFRLLAGGSRAAPPRHRTLTALVEWSYNLLTAPERRVFARLSVFAGGFTLEAAEAVCAGEGIPADDVLDMLVQLLDKSLVVAEGGANGVERFRLLETLRQYGWGRLTAEGDDERVGQRHARYYLTLAEEAEPRRAGPRLSACLARLDGEIDNLRAALRWYLGHGDAAEGWRLGHALVEFWWLRGRPTEGWMWLSKLRDLPESAVPSAARTMALAWAGSIARSSGDPAGAEMLLAEAVAAAQRLEDDRVTARVLLMVMRAERPHLASPYPVSNRQLAEHVLALYRRVGDLWGIGESLTRLAAIVHREGDEDVARRFAEEGLAIGRQSGHSLGIAFALETLGGLTIVENQIQARTHLEESLALYRDLGVPPGIATVENLLGRLDLLQARYHSARRHYQSSLRLTGDSGWILSIIQSLDGLAIVAAACGQPERAGRLGAATTQLRATTDAWPPPAEQADLDRALGPTHHIQDPTRVAAWIEGLTMTLEQAVAYALEEGND